MLQAFKPVLTKRDFSRRYAEGEFGNASPTWQTLPSFVEAVDWSGRQAYHLRNRVKGGPTYYNLHPREATDRWTKAEDLSQWYCSAMAPTELTVIQGEVMIRAPHGLELFYSRAQNLPMRDALQAAPQTAFGISAVTILRYFLCPNSLEWLHTLLSRYADHVIEFSTYDREWGTVQGYNTVFWEVRSY